MIQKAKLLLRVLLLLAAVIILAVGFLFLLRLFELDPTKKKEMQHLTETIEPKVSGKFYPGDKAKLKEQLDRLFSEARRGEGSEDSKLYSRRLRALLVPHAGYVYSGATAAKAYKLFNPHAYKGVLILAPAHFNRFEGVSTYPQLFYRTPLARSLRLDIPFGTGISLNAAHFENEHAAETQLPFLQYRLLEEGIDPEKYQISQFLYGAISPEKLARIIDDFVENNPEILLVLSTDLSHYHPLEKAEKLDASSIHSFLSLESDKALSSEACGRLGVSAFLKASLSHGVKPELLDYSTSAKFSGDSSRVVGYTSIAFFEEHTAEPTENTNQSLQIDWKSDSTFRKALWSYARENITQYLTQNQKQDYEQLLKSYPHLKLKGASFVTLLKGKERRLRGCIGSLIAHQSLIKDIQANSLSAALKDPRFPPVSSDELGDLTVEISLLGVPSLFFYRSKEELLDHLIPGEHGVILEHGNKRAVFLPQVWEQISDKAQFLDQLSQKGQIDPKAWREPYSGLHVYIFTVDKIVDPALRK